MLAGRLDVVDVAQLLLVQRTDPLQLEQLREAEDRVERGADLVVDDRHQPRLCIALLADRFAADAIGDVGGQSDHAGDLACLVSDRVVACLDPDVVGLEVECAREALAAEAEPHMIEHLGYGRDGVEHVQADRAAGFDPEPRQGTPLGEGYGPLGVTGEEDHRSRRHHLCQQHLALAEPIPVAQVADRAREEGRAIGFEARHRELDRDLGAVGAPGDELETAGETADIRVDVFLKALPMVHPIPLWNDGFRQLAADHLLLAVAEHPLSRGIESGDRPGAVDYDHRVERRIDHRRVASLALHQGGAGGDALADVLDVKDVELGHARCGKDD